MTPLLWPTVIFAIILVAHLAIPSRWVDGYVTNPDTGAKLRYRLNGLRVVVFSVSTWAFVCSMGWMSWDALYLERWQMLVGAFVVGVVFSLAIVLAAPPVEGNTFWQDLYLGRLKNPQWSGGRLDAKMFLYLAGATLLELNILSFTAHHLAMHPSDPSPGVLVYAALFSFFVCDYLTFEEVHLYTYDFMAERMGFKLGWGCLVFYPFFYCVGLWGLAPRPNPHTPGLLVALYAVIFFCGWALSRGANMQKYFFKKDPHAKAFGLLDPGTISDGTKHVLSGGFWGLSRHINYLGEILMATGLALSLGYPLSVLPWLYPLYYVALLLPRQIDDDRRCLERYGPLWQEYCRRVPYRIIPFVY